ncbi:MAG: S1C family serine protease, partial [Acidimicrobiales bacterium]
VEAEVEAEVEGGPAAEASADAGSPPTPGAGPQPVGSPTWAPPVPPPPPPPSPPAPSAGTPEGPTPAAASIESTAVTPAAPAPLAASTPTTSLNFLPPPPRPAAPSAASGGGRRWIAVAVIAAVIGALVGAGVTAIADDHDGGNNVTIHESNSAPGAAVLSGNVTIPQLVKEVIPAVVSIDVKAGGSEDEGTGMIITSNGEVVTNNHVIELFTDSTGGSITVTEYGQSKPLPTALVGYDTKDDVALLKIDNASNLPTVTFGSSTKTQVGDAVVAIGNALGLAAGTPTVTSGIVSALGRSVTAGGDGTATENLTNLIQTDAAINPGNSGGPLIDTAGQVIGMNTAVAGTTDDGADAENIGFAIPTAQVESLIPILEKGGPASNSGGYLGVDITTLTPALRQQYGFTPTSGAVILDVISGSPADKAGLQQGDVIVQVDNTPITSSEGLQSVIEGDKAGQVVQVTYYVGDDKHTTAVTLGSQAEAQQQESQQSNSDDDPFGGGGFPGLGGSGSGS